LPATPGLDLQEACVCAYSADGWQISDLDAADSARYRDYHNDPRPVADRAAAARAALCLSFLHSDHARRRGTAGHGRMTDRPAVPLP
jgi:hypothetical protein